MDPGDGPLINADAHATDSFLVPSEMLDRLIDVIERPAIVADVTPYHGSDL